MAEVLCPIIPSNSPLAQQQRPTTPEQYSRSASGQQTKPASRFVQMPRNNTYQTGGTGYRGTAAAPTYAFKATPSLQNQTKPAAQPQQPQQNGTAGQPLSNDPSAANRQRYPAAPSVSTTSSSTTSSNPSSTPSSQTTFSTWSQLFSKNDSTFSSNFEVAPFTTSNDKSGKETPKQEPAPENNPAAFPPPSRRPLRRTSTPGHPRRCSQTQSPTTPIRVRRAAETHTAATTTHATTTRINNDDRATTSSRPPCRPQTPRSGDGEYES